MRELTLEELKLVSGGFRFRPAPAPALMPEPGRPVNPSRFTGKVLRKPSNTGVNRRHSKLYRSQNRFTDLY